MLNDTDHLGKFITKADEAKFIGYTLTSKAYRAFHIISKTIVESINVSFDDSLLATSEQLNSRLKLNHIHSTRTFEAEVFEEPTCIPLSRPTNTSPSRSLSGPQAQGDDRKPQHLQVNELHVQIKPQKIFLRCQLKFISTSISSKHQCICSHRRRFQ